MSLRARLAFLYTTIVGGILFVFGTAVYVSISITLTNQVDQVLIQSANQVVRNSKAGSLGLSSLPELDLFADVYIQVWGRKGELISTSLNVRGFNSPLDPNGLNSVRPSFFMMYRWAGHT